MNRAALIAIILFLASVLQAQDVFMNDPDFDQNNPMNCNVYGNGGTVNFYDSAGFAGTYDNNVKDTLVVCPDLTLGTKVFISFGTNIGFIFDVDQSDSIYVFDGPDVLSPLLGVHNSDTDPNGFNHQASWENNPSGCLTLVFHSDAATNGAGWAANVACGNPPQPFNPHMKAYKNGVLSDSLNPSDTGMIQVCLGDSVLYVGLADFPYSLENTGFGYSQSDTSVDYKWFFSNGTVLNGDSVWFTPPNRAGYVVTLQVTDNFPNTEQIVSFVRVNPLMDFRSTRVVEDSICEGDTVILVAGLTNNDTVGANPTVAITEVGGAYAGLTYLPDGSGINYETEIAITGFGSGQLLTTGMDIMRLVITMEHSFLGDLEMMLTCPTGDSMIIFNAFPAQGIGPLFALGFGGGGTFLGDADDGFNGNPGIGWTYTFSDTIPDWGDMGTEWNAGNTLPTTISSGQGMNPDSIYLPEQSFSALVGCPINGNWKLTIRDNQGIDDGYIFDWAIYFNPFINPNFQSYSSTVEDAFWLDSDSVFIGGSGDTLVFDIPDSNGFSYYQFNVLDNFGCYQDTTISIFQTARTKPITVDTGTCADQLILEVNGADSALWQLISGHQGALSFSPDSTDTLVTVSTSAPGSFRLALSSFVNNCTFLDSVTVQFFPDIPIDVLGPDTLGCFDAFVILPNTDAANATYTWAPGTQVSDSIIVTQTGTYSVTVSGCNIAEDSIHVQFFKQPKLVAEALICDSAVQVDLNKFNLGGHWRILDSDIAMEELDTLVSQDAFSISTKGRGFVVVGYFDSLCNTIDSAVLIFEHTPSVSIIDSLLCEKDAPLTLRPVFSPKGTVSYRWNDGTTDSVLVVFTPGVYDLKLSNACGTAYDSVHVKFRNCNYLIPNVITPNSDGINDVFYILNDEFYNEISMLIYNRWGQKVYEGSGPLARWDGYQSGERASEGTYYYVVTIDGFSIHGSFTLLFK